MEEIKLMPEIKFHHNKKELQKKEWETKGKVYFGGTGLVGLLLRFVVSH